MLLALFCGICVSDYDIAAEWYVRLLGGDDTEGRERVLRGARDLVRRMLESLEVDNLLA